MSADQWLGFLTVMLVAYLIPGPDALIVLRQASTGRRAGLLAGLGAQTGLCVHMLVAALGLGLVLATRPAALTIIRIAGGLYLIWLGSRLVISRLRSRATPIPNQARAPERHDHRTAFRQGLITNLTNPKAILFFAAILPQFIDPVAPTAPQILLLGAIDVTFGLILWTLLSLFAARLGRRLRSTRSRDRRDMIIGAILAALGVVIAAGAV